MALLSRLGIISVVIGVLLSVVTEAAAASQVRRPGNVGIGLGVGYASGISAKYMMSQETAIQGTVGTFGAFDDDADGIAIGGDFLLEMPAFVTHEAIELAWNIGAGAGLAIFDDDGGDDDFAFSVQGVLGLEVNLVPIPLDVVIEFRPELRILEDPDFDIIDFGAHVRYYF